MICLCCIHILGNHTILQSQAFVKKIQKTAFAVFKIKLQSTIFSWSRIRESKLRAAPNVHWTFGDVRLRPSNGLVSLLPGSIFHCHISRKKNRKQVGSFSWSRIRESNPCHQLGRLAYYHYTNPAVSEAI